MLPLSDQEKAKLEYEMTYGAPLVDPELMHQPWYQSEWWACVWRGLLAVLSIVLLSLAFATQAAAEPAAYYGGKI